MFFFFFNERAHGFEIDIYTERDKYISFKLLR
jgi:hypothetical protein